MIVQKLSFWELTSIFLCVIITFVNLNTYFTLHVSHRTNVTFPKEYRMDGSDPLILLSDDRLYSLRETLECSLRQYPPSAYREDPHEPDFLRSVSGWWGKGTLLSK
jgi:hypothetical protein